jgi:serine/threonine-protein kinase
MAPELVIDTAPASAATDMFSFGVLAYLISSGQRPFETAPFSLVRRRGELPTPPSLVELCPELDPALGELIGRCIERDPRARPAATELLAALEAEIADRPRD